MSSIDIVIGNSLDETQFSRQSFINDMDTVWELNRMEFRKEIRTHIINYNSNRDTKHCTST